LSNAPATTGRATPVRQRHFGEAGQATRCLALEYLDAGIRVNSVVVGGAMTGSPLVACTRRARDHRNSRHCDRARSVAATFSAGIRDALVGNPIRRSIPACDLADSSRCVE
jgi:NAD(P)-dependent dehydrogenase (short-subunit alcohol dehydrogenase family)